ncbi:hypothetical protein CEUSTIGMA_g8043.t1 [Chlamydomonas eustigma]|uniref:Uncharacterized protein n=1 Tax=Chlamydomonas eustigma TaxID=1157962 RepID=A0A250XC08_9CHLO|nr:hypothetical protein CEUSTIGMA_g8043.t1 [Chlamydomonas eustigma]|eukprot:GAX80608.1 hypothetical protein CEUSTIGMA_g8043.t1 [Chlamydomonas eustigma]
MPKLELRRCDRSRQSPLTALSASNVTCARLQADNDQLVTYADGEGVLHQLKLGAAGSDALVLASFELVSILEEDHIVQPVVRAWQSFEFLDSGGSSIVFSQRGNNKLLFCQLPLLDDGGSGVFLFGDHSGDVLCTTRSSLHLVSGSSDGTLKVWDVEDGSMVDSKVEPSPSAKIMALQFIGSFLLAAGSSLGTVTVYDMTTSKLQAIQRLTVDSGPVSSLAACLPFQLERQVASTHGTRPFDGGGVVGWPAGLPWRLPGSNAEEAGSSALLAVGSDAGWLHIFQPRQPGEGAWVRQYSGNHMGKVKLAFSPDGSCLALASGYESGSLTLLDTLSWQPVKQWAFPSALAAVSFGSHFGSELGVEGGFPTSPALGASTPLSAGSHFTPVVSFTLCAVPERGLPTTLRAKVHLSALQTPAHHPDARHMPSRRNLDLGQKPVVLAASSQPPPYFITTDLSSPQRSTVGGQPSTSVELLNGASPYNVSARPALPLRPARSIPSSPALQPIEPSFIDVSMSLGGASSLPQSRLGIRPSTMPRARSWLTGDKPDPGLLIETLAQPSTHGAYGSIAPHSSQNPQAPQTNDTPQCMKLDNGGQVQPLSHAFSTDDLCAAEGHGELLVIAEEETDEVTAMESNGLGASTGVVQWQQHSSPGAKLVVADEKSHLGPLGSENLTSLTDTWRNAEPSCGLTQSDDVMFYPGDSMYQQGLPQMYEEDDLEAEPAPRALPVHLSASRQVSREEQPATRQVSKEQQPTARQLSRKDHPMHSQEPALIPSCRYRVATHLGVSDTASDEFEGEGSAEEGTSAQSEGRNHEFQQTTYFGDELKRYSGDGDGAESYEAIPQERSVHEGVAEGVAGTQVLTSWAQVLETAAMAAGGAEAEAGGHLASATDPLTADTFTVKTEADESEEPLGAESYYKDSTSHQAGVVPRTSEVLSGSSNWDSICGPGDFETMDFVSRVPPSSNVRDCHNSSAPKTLHPKPDSKSATSRTTPVTAALNRQRAALARLARRGTLSKGFGTNAHHRLDMQGEASFVVAEGGRSEDTANLDVASRPPIVPPAPRRFLGYKPNTARLLQQIKGTGQGNAPQNVTHGKSDTSQKENHEGDLVAEAAASPSHHRNKQVPQHLPASPLRLSSSSVYTLRRPSGGRASRHHKGGNALVNFPGGGSMMVPSGASSPATLPSLSSPMLMASPDVLPTSVVDQQGNPYLHQQRTEHQLLAQPELYSTCKLIKRMEGLMRDEGQQRGSPLTPAQREEALRKAATCTANIPTAACLYPPLPVVDPATIAAAPMAARQLHPGWVAGRSIHKPELGALWSAAEQQPGICNPRAMTYYSRPLPAEVTQHLLALPL